MATRRPPELEEHPDVAPIERLLPTASQRFVGPVPVRDGRVVADRAAWSCACDYDDDRCLHTPTWLIYDAADGRLGWSRVPVGVRETRLVDAESMTGDHVSAELARGRGRAILAW